MKFAIISDIHANLPAFEAVLRDIERENPDEVYCLGDLVNFAGWDNDVVHLIRQHNILTIQGNHDEGIGNCKSHFPFSFANQSQEEFGVASIKKVNDTLSDDHRSYLRNLPFSVSLQFRFPYHPVNLVLTHGSPLSNNDYIQPESPDEVLKELLDIAGADILLMGHTHRPFHRPLLYTGENREIYRHAINVGSVGKPKHGTPEACYALLEFDENLRLEDPETLSVKFRYVKYDTHQVIRHLQSLGLSNAYDKFLQTGQ